VIEDSVAMKYLILPALFTVSLAASAQTKETAIGCWKMPSRAGEMLQLSRDGNFTFDDYNSLTKATEHFYGTWKLAGKEITLMYDDRPQQHFYLFKDKTGKWRLRKAGGFQFTKAEAGECGSR
jgi:hypothetical protein